jgi:hypothetical protein
MLAAAARLGIADHAMLFWTEDEVRVVLQAG